MKFFDTALKLEFEPYDDENLTLLQEFHQTNNAALNRWKKLASKVNFSEGEELLFNLLLSLKDDIIKLEDKINQKNSFAPLKFKNIVCGIAFEGIKLQDECLQGDAVYYGRIELNHQVISFFFKALDTRQGVITQIKKEDSTLYDNFVVEMQRQIINTSKGKEQ